MIFPALLKLFEETQIVFEECALGSGDCRNAASSTPILMPKAKPEQTSGIDAHVALYVRTQKIFMPQSSTPYICRSYPIVHFSGRFRSNGKQDGRKRTCRSSKGLFRNRAACLQVGEADIVIRRSARFHLVEHQGVGLISESALINAFGPAESMRIGGCWFFMVRICTPGGLECSRRVASKPEGIVVARAGLIPGMFSVEVGGKMSSIRAGGTEKPSLAEGFETVPIRSRVTDAKPPFPLRRPGRRRRWFSRSGARSARRLSAFLRAIRGLAPLVGLPVDHCAGRRAVFSRYVARRLHLQGETTFLAKIFDAYQI